MPRPRYHAVVSLTLAAIVVAGTRRPRAALPILVAGVLVDLDHLVDLTANRMAGLVHEERFQRAAVWMAEHPADWF